MSKPNIAWNQAVTSMLDARVQNLNVQLVQNHFQPWLDSHEINTSRAYGMVTVFADWLLTTVANLFTSADVLHTERRAEDDVVILFRPENKKSNSSSSLLRCGFCRFLDGILLLYTLQLRGRNGSGRKKSGYAKAQGEAEENKNAISCDICITLKKESSWWKTMASPGGFDYTDAASFFNTSLILYETYWSSFSSGCCFLS